MLNFQMYEKVKVVYGNGAINQLGELAKFMGATKALIVADADADHGQRLLFIRSVGGPAFRLPPAAGGKGPQNGRQKDRPIRGYFTTAARFAKESLCKT